jgi:hypothetical protein
MTKQRLVLRANGRWELEGTDDKHAKSLIPHGCDATTYKLTRKAWAEQGAPTINRATRRKGQRVGDAARRKKAKEES